MTRSIALVVVLGNALFGASPVFTVRVYTYGTVARPKVERAEQEAGRVFRRAGVEIAWTDCRLAAPTCEDSPSLGAIVLRVLERQPPGESAGVLGYAVSGPFATVYALEAGMMADAAGAERSVILGITIAHEIGHVLLGPDSHSDSGIMKAPWRKKDLLAAAQHALAFTPSEAQRLRADRQSRQYRLAASPGIEEIGNPPM